MRWYLRDSTLADRKLQTVIGNRPRRLPRDLYDTGWLVHERPDLIANADRAKLKAWLEGLTAERRAALEESMRRDGGIGRCDVESAWRLLEAGVASLETKTEPR